MSVLRGSAALLLALAACSGRSPGRPGSGGGPDGGPPTGSGQPPPGPTRGRHAISGLGVEPGGERVWYLHSAVADVDATPAVTTSHLGLYLPAMPQFAEVLDTTGTLGEAILFPGPGRLLHVTRRGTDRDVFVLLDTTARRPLDQRSYPGDRGNFRLSPSGRLLLSTDASDHRLHLLDTQTLIDQPLPDLLTSLDSVEWDHADDVFHFVRADATDAIVQRYDLRTADLAQPLPAPTTIARVAGSPLLRLLVSLDDRFAAFELTQQPASKIALVGLATGNTTVVSGLRAEAFTNDHRVVITDGSTVLRIVDPATGAATDPVTLPGVVSITALRRRDALLIGPLSIAGSPFLYRIADGARTPLSRRIDTTTMYERPGHDEIWEWSEFSDALSRFDLTTGTAALVATDVEQIAFRPDADGALLATDHQLQQLPLSSTTGPGSPTLLPDPNDEPALYRLDDR